MHVDALASLPANSRFRGVWFWEVLHPFDLTHMPRSLPQLALESLEVFTAVVGLL
jgi:hypothetical protein